MNKVAEILLESLLPVNNTYVTHINTNNGVLNNDYIEREKQKFFRDSSKYLIEDLVKTVQEYPVEDISEVKMSTEFYVLRKEDLERILQLEE